MGTAPGTSYAGYAARLWCRTCGQPVALISDIILSPHLSKAVHTATGEEKGPDGHLAAPTWLEPAGHGSGEDGR